MRLIRRAPVGRCHWLLMNACHNSKLTRCRVGGLMAVGARRDRLVTVSDAARWIKNEAAIWPREHKTNKVPAAL